jgi:ribosome-associated heat shock protein Hsp15
MIPRQSSSEKTEYETFGTAISPSLDRMAGQGVDAVSARVDAWLWSIRICSTRSAATAACRGGHVKVNGTTVKAAYALKVGDRVTCHVHERHRDLEVIRLLSKRVGTPFAIECYVDHSPPPEPSDPLMAFASPATGRPTKRDRRHLDRLRGR